MMVGAFPALLTFFIRLFVPESERWQEAKARGATTGWATRDLLAVVIGAAGPGLIIALWASDESSWLPHTLALRIAGYPRVRIYDHVWDENYEGSTNIVDVYVSSLRKKLEQPFGRPLIRTMRGVGYIMGDEP